MPTSDSSLTYSCLPDKARDGAKRCIEVTIGSEESLVGVLDHPK